MDIIRVSHLAKNYGLIQAVNDVSFNVGQGEIFGILGPNGAGKTTTLECLEGLRKASSGHLEVLGLNLSTDAKIVKDKIGIQLQASTYFDNLTLFEILELFGKFYSRRTSPMDLLTAVGLEHKRNTTVAKLSGGQSQRFTIAATLVNDPELIFLDEPTTGLDPRARRSMWELILNLKGDKRTILLTTHYMEEAEILCDRVAIMDQGSIVALDSPRNLIKGLTTPYEIRVAFNQRIPSDQLNSLDSVLDVEDAEYPIFTLHCGDLTKSIPSIFALSRNRQATVTQLEVRSGNLEDVFLKLTGKYLENHVSGEE